MRVIARHTTNPCLTEHFTALDSLITQSDVVQKSDWTTLMVFNVVECLVGYHNDDAEYAHFLASQPKNHLP